MTFTILYEREAERSSIQNGVTSKDARSAWSLRRRCRQRRLPSKDDIVNFLQNMKCIFLLGEEEHKETSCRFAEDECLVSLAHSELFDHSRRPIVQAGSSSRTLAESTPEPAGGADSEQDRSRPDSRGTEYLAIRCVALRSQIEPRPTHYWR
jgi:hypothetical protein